MAGFSEGFAYKDRRIETAEWCGDRRTVVGREGPVFARLAFGGFFGLPHKVSIKNQLVMAFSGIESGLRRLP
ncbi:hypothetical protein D3C77_359120 [compost metagenome]